MIETIAIAIGTIARNEANTNASTIRAPRPPRTDSSSTPVPLSPPDSFWSASKPLTCTGTPPTAEP